MISEFPLLHDLPAIQQLFRQQKKPSTQSGQP